MRKKEHDAIFECFFIESLILLSFRIYLPTVFKVYFVAFFVIIYFLQLCLHCLEIMSLYVGGFCVFDSR